MRFDRQQGAEGWRRLHSIDACQLLGLSAAYKYLEGGVGRLAELAAACRSAAVGNTAPPCTTHRHSARPAGRPRPPWPGRWRAARGSPRSTAAA
nr:HipA domain-containing protein [Azotobacter chroococcum]